VHIARLGGAESKSGQPGPSPRPSQPKKIKGQTKNDSVWRAANLITYALGLDLLDLMTKAVNMIQRAWINRNPTLQIFPRHLTAKKINSERK
jgi:hypothetical protein